MLRVSIIACLIAIGAAPATAGGFPCERFVHNDDGSWRTLEPLTIEGPGGRKIDFTPNETYKVGQDKLGLDMAKLLDSNCVKK